MATGSSRFPLRALVAYRRLAIVCAHLCIVAAFALVPLYYRFTITAPPPFGLPDLYVSRFLVFLPMLGALASWLLSGAHGFRRILRHPVRRVWALSLLVLALWTLASGGWAFMRLSQPALAWSGGVQFAVVALFAVAAASLATVRLVRVAAFALVLVGTFSALVVIVQAAAQGAVGLRVFDEQPYTIDTPGISILQAGTARYLRPYGLMPHPNIAAGALVLALLAAVWLLRVPRSAIRERSAALPAAAVPVLFGALLLTFSRAAWIAAGVAFAVPWAAALLYRVRKRLPAMPTRRQGRAALALSGFVGMAFVVAYAPFLFARAGGGAENVEQRSIADRVVFTRLAVASITESPARFLFGVGVGNLPWRTAYQLAETEFDLRGDYVHNHALAALAELGAVGAALTLTALICGVWAAVFPKDDAPLLTAPVDSDVGVPTAILASAGAHPHPSSASALGLGFTLALLVIGLFDHYPYTLLPFQMALWGGLALALSSVHEPSPPL